MARGKDDDDWRGGEQPVSMQLIGDLASNGSVDYADTKVEVYGVKRDLSDPGVVCESAAAFSARPSEATSSGHRFARSSGNS